MLIAGTVDPGNWDALQKKEKSLSSSGHQVSAGSPDGKFGIFTSNRLGLEPPPASLVLNSEIVFVLNAGIFLGLLN